MVAYNERILATSQSPQRIHRAKRMLVNLQPIVVRLEQEQNEVERSVSKLSRTIGDDEYDVVFSGRESLIGARPGGSSLA